MIVKFVIAVMTLAGPVQARAATKTQPYLDGVSREIRVHIRLPAGARVPTALLLPGGQAIEVDLPVDAETVERAVAASPAEFGTQVSPLADGARLRIVHPRRRLIFVEGTRGRSARVYTLLTGAQSEDTRLRQFADELRRPLPQPRNLGAHLELWQEAERATSEGKLKHARRLWQKLAEQEALVDLAKLRIAELFIISGHVNAATDLLRHVSRDHPRSTGAGLARLAALRLAVIIGEDSPTPDQVVTAANAGTRHRFQPFTWLRATRILMAINASDVALHSFPSIEQLPEQARDEARRARDALVSAAIGVPATTGRPFAAVVQYRAWATHLSGNPHLATIQRLVAQSYVELGLCRPAIPLYRAVLDKSTSASSEAALVSDLAEAYHGIGDLTHAAQVIRYQVSKHADAPRLSEQILSLALQTQIREGTPAASELLASIRESIPGRSLRRKIIAHEIDFAEAWGKPAEHIQLLQRMRAIGYDNAQKRGSALARAFARDGRSASAVPLLRAWIGRSTEPETRDEMVYLLARAEEDLGKREDAEKILQSIAGHSTHWGLVARARLREAALTRIVAHVEQRNRKNLDR